MPFEVYHRGARRVTDQPAATIDKNGSLRLNRAARSRLELFAGRQVLAGDAVVLGWRETPRAIGVRAGLPDDRPTALHKITEAGASIAINAKQFLTAHALLDGSGRALRWPVSTTEIAKDSHPDRDPYWVVIDLTGKPQEVTRKQRTT